MIEVFLYDLSKGKLSRESIFKLVNIELNDIRYTAKGKPFLKKKYISISHSGKWFVFCLSDGNVGIDIQCMEKKRSSDFIVEICNIELSQKSFYYAWSKIESYLKYTGEGLAGFTSKDFIINENVLKPCISDSYIDTIQVGRDYVMSICYQKKAQQISYTFLNEMR